LCKLFIFQYIKKIKTKTEYVKYTHIKYNQVLLKKKVQLLCLNDKETHKINNS